MAGLPVLVETEVEARVEIGVELEITAAGDEGAWGANHPPANATRLARRVASNCSIVPVSHW
jgi:hypothetical protein